LRATLGLLEKLTLEPGGLGPEDVRPVLALGVSHEALVDAFHVAFLFNVYDRLADTLGWEVPPPEFFRRGARRLLERGYG
jgi:alkylhydroperoxidase family enzyme